MIVRILSLTKGTTGAENINSQDPMFFQPTPTVEIQLASASWRQPEAPVFL
ncbi:MAG: hypothetical protein ABI600_18120 [Luteolibacter sp.]